MSRRVMARPVPVRRARTRLRMVVPLIAAVAVLALAVATIPALLTRPNGGEPSAPPNLATPLVAQQPSTAAPSSDSGSAGSGGGVRPSRPRATARPARPASLAPAATTAPSSPALPAASPSTAPPTIPGAGAPTQPSAFDLRRQQIDIGFPLRPDTDYAYRDNFLDPRDGAPEAYNHGRLDREGTTLRLHDGIDIYADLGEPLVAPFSGTVIDPATRWQPWVEERYGEVVVIVSDEPTTAGYIGLLAHLDRVWIEVGQRVTRGQVLGTVGRTGNAEAQSIRPHVHFELRAPFLLDWTQLGHDHVLDAFNPFHSLVAADPKRTP